MKNLLIFTFCVLLFGCKKTVVNENDATPPTMTARILGAANLAFYEDSGESVNGTALISGRSVIVRPRNDSEEIPLLISAVDEESGIRFIRSSVKVSYKCVAKVVGGWVERQEEKFLDNEKSNPLDHSEEGIDTSLVSVSFSYEDLWTKCMNWGQIINVRSGRLENIEVEYVGTATNNALQPGVTQVNGSFKVANGRAALSQEH